MADNVLKYKYAVKNVGPPARHKTATFMPKPLYDEYGSGMHVHTSSLAKGGKNLFAGSRYSNLSEVAACTPSAGCFKHAPALCAFTNPTTNSLQAARPGVRGADHALAYSPRNRSAAIRIPGVLVAAEESKRYRVPAAGRGSANPYLAFAAILMAMLDGIRNKIHPGPPLEKDIYDMPPEELKDVPKHAGPTWTKRWWRWRSDHEFLLQGGRVHRRRDRDVGARSSGREEVEAIRLRPHPYEFALYYDT